MKRAFLAVIAAMFCTAGTASEEGAVWSTAIATRPSDGHVIVYRYRSEFGPSFKRSLYPDRVVIAWAYKSESGMPSTAERESMDEMENLLAPHVEQDAVATLALVSTGEGLREWVYYAASKEEFMARMNKALQGLPRFPVEIDLWRDAEWTRYETFRQGVRK
ncbi:MAG TPA: DUF695 domain-containing protein [Noviherbaspirillum sp.]